MTNEGGLCFLLTIIYASNNREERKLLWEEGLMSITHNTNNVPLVALGDFNEITYPKERISQGDCNHGGPSEFLHVTMASHMIELPSIGGDFTWTNNAVGSSRQSRLDKALTNLHWMDVWPHSRLECFIGTSSDHVTMIISFTSIEKGSKPFRL